MKTRLALLLCLAIAAHSRADEPAAPASAIDNRRLTGEQLEQLLSPVALYPDALIALILPAATAPADIVLAARYLKDNGDPAAVESRSWDESVKSLVHYAAVVKWMDDNLAWTKQVGEAFRDQPAEVMQAIQRLRAQARAAGTLLDSPQQQVVADGEVISIVPAQANYLYVPYYDPLVVYSPRSDYYGTTPFVTFSSPFLVGSWLRFDCDWRQRTVWTVDRRWTSRDGHDWRHPVFPGQPGYVNDPNRHPWRPPSSAPRLPVASAPRHGDIHRPAPINAIPQLSFASPGAPNRPDNLTDQPQRNIGRNRDQNFYRPIAVAPTAAATPVVGPAPVIAPPSPRRGDPGHHRYEPGDRPNRSLAFQNPSASFPAATNQPTVTAPRAVPSRFPFGPPPATPIVPAFVGPVISPMPAHAPSQPQSLRMPAPAPAAAPATPSTTPDRPRFEDRRRTAGENEVR